MAAATNKAKSILFDLGKPTMRGVRKCPKCGTLNGTRGISCKNKGCDVVFKEKDRKRGHSADAVKIVTGTGWHICSVRLRDRGPDFRGFVQLPIVQDMDGNPAENVEFEVLAGAARCHVENCVGVYKGDACHHIKSAVECKKEATPLPFKSTVLNSMSLNQDLKQALWLLASECVGPMVQRVTKDIMVVKCQVSVKNPLGFLHCSFFESKGKSGEGKFQCGCKATVKSRGTPVKGVSVKEENRCIHFYACMCGFASNEKLAEEFSQHLQFEGSPFSKVEGQNLMLVPPANNSNEEHSGIMASEIPTSDVIGPEISADQNLEVMIIDDSVGLTLLESDSKRARLDTADGILEGSVEALPDDIVTTEPHDITSPAIEAQASTALLTLQEAAPIEPQKATPKKALPNILRQTTTTKPATPVRKPAAAPSETETLSWTFQEWLGSVTERVNQSMHYQFDGNPDPLVFHSPQKFFDVLQHRISTGNKKRRLPNSTTGFVRKDALPLGAFTKYTWHITNILHVKQIFDTVEVPLKITRSFVENRDGTFDSYEPPPLKSGLEGTDGSKNIARIRPFELKTYLKVGNTARDQTEPTPFIIEWIPDILPFSRIGELRIKFEYGHERNGQIEHRTQTPQPLAVVPI